MSAHDQKTVQPTPAEDTSTNISSQSVSPTTGLCPEYEFVDRLLAQHPDLKQVNDVLLRALMKSMEQSLDVVSKQRDSQAHLYLTKAANFLQAIQQELTARTLVADPTPAPGTKNPHKDVVYVKDRTEKPPAPLFDGQLINWRRFLEKFKIWLVSSHIDNEYSKFYNLLPCLGKSATVVDDIPMEPGCFDEALKLLDARFNNPKKARIEILRRLSEYRAVSSSTNSKEMTALVDFLKKTNNYIKTWSENKYYDEVFIETFLIPEIKKKTPPDLRFLLVTKKFLSVLDFIQWFQDFIDVNFDQTPEVAFVSHKTQPHHPDSDRQHHNFGSGHELGINRNRNQHSDRSHSNHNQSSNKHEPTINAVNVKNPNPHPKKSRTFGPRQMKCVFCAKDHAPSLCTKFVGFDIRLSRLRQMKVCNTCLHNEHQGSCRKIPVCPNCKQEGHYKALCPKLSAGQSGGLPNHGPAQNAPKHDESQPMKNMPTINAVSLPNQFQELFGRQKFLRAKVVGTIGTFACRIFLDQGAQFCVATKSFIDKIGVDVNSKRLQFGLGTGYGKQLSLGSAKLDVISLFGSYQQTFKCHVVEHINADDGNVCDRLAAICESKGIILADLVNGNRPEDPIDILLGCNEVDRLIVRSVPLIDNLLAFETKFGWCLSGADPTITGFSAHIDALSVPTKDELFDLARFWSVEDLDSTNVEEANKIMEDFQSGIIFNGERYMVPLPFTSDPSQLNSNFSQAVKRLFTLKAKLLRTGNYEMYNKSINDYLLKQHAIQLTNYDREEGFYIPHSMVEFKHRVVFDCSAHGAGQKSLNDCLTKGVDLNVPIMTNLIQMRLKPVAFVADIEKAFPQILIEPDHQKYLRYLWFDKEGRMICCQLTTLLFGATCSPFVLAATVRHHLQSMESRYPLAAASKNNFYVDDLAMAVDSVEEAIAHHDQLVDAFKSCNMNLRKWRCSDQTLDKLWRNSDETEVSVLGLGWEVSDDCFFIRSKFDTTLVPNSKRQFLSTMSHPFDPIGMMAFAAVKCKLFIQKLHLAKLDWDVPLPQEMHEEAKSALSDITGLDRIRMPRHPWTTHPSSLDIFCDASSYAYGVVVYLVDSTGKRCFLMAKSRIAPIKKLTIPELELTAAHLAVKLWTIKLKSILPEVTCRFFSDSQVTIQRLQKKFSERLSPFIRNRITFILKETKVSQWSHVKSELNPADIVSRGCSIDHFCSNKVLQQLWWNGDPPAPSISALSTIHKGLLGSHYCHVRSWSLFDSMIRWIVRARRKRDNRSTKLLYEIVRNRWLQSGVFDEEIKYLSDRLTSENPGSKFITFMNKYQLVLDSDGILRSRTRLNTGNPDTDSPVILQGGSHATLSWLKHQHLFYNHPGLTTLNNILAPSFLILNFRQALNAVKKGCWRCRLHSTSDQPKPEYGFIPRFRTECAVFKNVGIDHFGPFQITEYRSRKPFLVHVLIVVCAVTRAIHLELTNHLDAASTWQALHRTFDRRGVPSLIVSDNHKTFKAMADYIRREKEDPTIFTSTPSNVEWRFIPEYSPWHGGFYERLIGCVKRVLNRTIDKRILNREAFSTLLTQTEAIPSSERTEAETLPILALSQFDQQETATLWNRWKTEYLTTLRNRWWKESQPTVKIGDTVLVKNYSPSWRSWPIGTISKSYPGTDGTTRIVDVKINDQILRRDVRHLVSLEGINPTFRSI